MEAEVTYMEHPSIRQGHFGNVKAVFGMKVGFLIGGPWLLARCGGDLGAIAGLLLVQSVGMLLFRYYGAVVASLIPAEESG